MTVEEQDQAKSAEAPVEPESAEKTADSNKQPSQKESPNSGKSFRPSPGLLNKPQPAKEKEKEGEEARSFAPEGEAAIREPEPTEQPPAVAAPKSAGKEGPAKDKPGPGKRGRRGERGERGEGRGDRRRRRDRDRDRSERRSGSPVPQRPPVPVPIRPIFEEQFEDEDAGLEQELLEEMSEFEEHIDQYLPDSMNEISGGDTIDATIVGIRDDDVLLDVGDKAECTVPKNEFTESDGTMPFAVGDTVKVFVKGRSDSGQFHVSYKRALRMAGVTKLQEAHQKKQLLEGKVVKEVKGGLIVDIFGVQAFMPASHVDLRRVDNLSEWVDKDVRCYIIDFNRDRKRIIASRRAVLEEEQQLIRETVIGKLSIGEVVGATVKSITDFGAFVDLGGGVDGLIPREEVSWERGGHPSEYLKLGEPVNVKVLSITRSPNKTKISLSRKQAKADPFEILPVKYPEGSEVEGEVVGITHFGAFVRIEEGIQGMIHVSDLSWSGGNKRVKDYVKEGDKVKCVVLEIDQDRRRLSLGMKQLQDDPWELIEHRFPVGARVEGEVTSLVPYGAFVKISDELEGLVHISDFSWDRKITKPSQMLKKGDKVVCKVLEIDRENRRLSLGVKQLEASPFENFLIEHKVGDKIRGKVTKLETFGAFVQVAPAVEGLLHVSQIAEERIEDPKQVLKPGDEIEVKITKIDRKNEKVSLSRREVMRDLEREEIQTYMQSGNVSGGLSFGELLREAQLGQPEEEKAETPSQPEGEAAEPEQKTEAVSALPHDQATPAGQQPSEAESFGAQPFGETAIEDAPRQPEAPAEATAAEAPTAEEEEKASTETAASEPMGGEKPCSMEEIATEEKPNLGPDELSDLSARSISAPIEAAGEAVDEAVAPEEEKKQDEGAAPSPEGGEEQKPDQGV